MAHYGEDQVIMGKTMELGGEFFTAENKKQSYAEGSELRIEY